MKPIEFNSEIRTWDSLITFYFKSSTFFKIMCKDRMRHIVSQALDSGKLTFTNQQICENYLK